MILINEAGRKKDIEYELNENGCFICTSHKLCSNGRYYNIKRDGKVILLHRYVYETIKGEIPENLILRHTCDNVKCINPNHLITGSHQENMNDMVERNRSNKHEKNPLAKLTMKDAMEIRELHNSITGKEISKRFNISESLVSQVVNFKIWT